jgi:hypothetical protein
LAKIGQRRTRRHRILGQLLSPRTKRTPPSTASVSKQGLAHVHTRNVRFGENWVSERRHSPQQLPVVSATPKGPHRIVMLSDSEPTKRHETRGHSSWFDVVLSRIRLHSLRMSSVSACKHRGALGRSGGRRLAAPSNAGHVGAQGTLRIDRDTHPQSQSLKL